MVDGIVSGISTDQLKRVTMTNSGGWRVTNSEKSGSGAEIDIVADSFKIHDYNGWATANFFNGRLWRFQFTLKDPRASNQLCAAIGVSLQQSARTIVNRDLETRIAHDDGQCIVIWTNRRIEDQVVRWASP